jgi:hypothetical protein
VLHFSCGFFDPVTGRWRKSGALGHNPPMPTTTAIQRACADAGAVYGGLGAMIRFVR